MSEEEINKKIDYFNQHDIDINNEKSEKILRELISFINEILDLYNKEKEKNKELEEINAEHLEAITEWVNGERINDIKHISKDKIKEKIKELTMENKINKRELEEGIEYLNTRKINFAIKKIESNITIRHYLNELLKEN